MKQKLINIILLLLGVETIEDLDPDHQEFLKRMDDSKLDVLCNLLQIAAISNNHEYAETLANATFYVESKGMLSKVKAVQEFAAELLKILSGPTLDDALPADEFDSDEAEYVPES